MSQTVSSAFLRMLIGNFGHFRVLVHFPDSRQLGTEPKAFSVGRLALLIRQRFSLAALASKRLYGAPACASDLNRQN